ncbi:MAG: hypothetical protein AAGD92_16270 [Pseudomonadota bacterium]
MTRKNMDPKLPEGVLPDNAGDRSATQGSFTAPNVATPQFLNGENKPPVTVEASAVNKSGLASGFANTAKPQTRRDNPSRDKQNITILIAIVALAMALAAVFRIYNPRESEPACSELPEWNQYNCRVE